MLNEMQSQKMLNGFSKAVPYKTITNRLFLCTAYCPVWSETLSFLVNYCVTEFLNEGKRKEMDRKFSHLFYQSFSSKISLIWTEKKIN